MGPKLPPRSGRRGLTIKDLAVAAGVSMGTASNAMNGAGRVSQETRDKVLRVAAEIGYRPNDLAQSLHRSRSMSVGVISNDSFGRFVFPIVEALDERFADKGIAIFMCNATDDPEREKQHLDQLLRKRIDGLIVAARRIDARRPIGPVPPDLPVIYINSQPETGDAVSILPDEVGGAELGTRHLIEVGCRRIAHVTGPTRFDSVHLRRAGYAAALAEAGLPVLDELFLPGPWSETWGREAVARLFDAGGPVPDGLFCGNDQIARGAADALFKRGIRVPDEVAIVGFDNWKVMTDEADPPLTSIDMNLRDLGAEAARTLIEMMEGEDAVAPGIRRLPCTLVTRESTDRTSPRIAPIGVST